MTNCFNLFCVKPPWTNVTWRILNYSKNNEPHPCFESDGVSLARPSWEWAPLADQILTSAEVSLYLEGLSLMWEMRYPCSSSEPCFSENSTLNSLLSKEITEQLDEFLCILYCGILYLLYIRSWLVHGSSSGQSKFSRKSSEIKTKCIQPSCDSE